ncbi:MAG: DUF6093 family protein [Frankiaceae bacterium]
MSAAAATLRGRRLAESLMVDKCVVKRQSGTEYDPSTRKNVPTYTTVYDDPDEAGAGAKCQVQAQTQRPRDLEAGERLVIEKAHVVKLPITALGVSVGDIVTMTAVDSVTGDPELVGRKLVVRDVLAKTYATARRLTCEEQS